MQNLYITGRTLSERDHVIFTTLSDFQQYLLSRKVPEKSGIFCAYWANQNLTLSKRLKNADAAEALRLFLVALQSWENIADWQIQ